MTLLSAIVAVAMLGTSPAPPESFVPGEVMVKFAAGSEADAAVERVSKTVPLQLDALASHVRKLEQETDIPLTAGQVTSGKWVVLKVDVEKLNSNVVERLRKHQNVAQVHLTEADGSFIGFSPPKKVAVKFVPGSPEAKTVSEKLRNQGENDFRKLVSSLEQKVASPLTCEAVPREELLVQVDLKSLTLKLQERLNSLPSVEATQLNHVMKAF